MAKRMWEQIILSRNHYRRTASIIFKARSSHASVWALSSIIFSRSNLYEVSQYSFHLGRLFLPMKGKANVHVDDEWTMSAYVGIKTGSNMNSAMVQHKLYVSSQRLYTRGTNQNETLLCWISASTYSSMNLFQAPSVRTVEDDTLTHGCDG